MPILATYITAAYKEVDSNYYKVLKTGTFTTTPGETDTIMAVTPSTAVIQSIGGNNESVTHIPEATTDVGRYLCRTATRDCVKITAVTADTITIERPFRVSELRAVNNSRGEAYSEDAFQNNEAYSISINLLDLDTIDGDNDNNVLSLSNSTRNEWLISTNDNSYISLPNDCWVIEDGFGSLSGPLAHNFFSNPAGHGLRTGIQFGRIHPNWKSDEETPQIYYTSGGWQLLDQGTNDSSSWTDDSNENRRCSFKFIDSAYINVSENNIFFRAYGYDSDGDNLRNYFINCNFEGAIGGRLEGEKSYITGLSSAFNDYRAFNLRSNSGSFFGFYESAVKQSNSSIYVYPSESAAVTVFSNIETFEPLDNNDSGLVWIANGGNSNSNKIVYVDDIDVASVKALETDLDNWEFQNRSGSGSFNGYSNSFTIVRATYSVNMIDSVGADFAQPGKLFIHTPASGDQDDQTYTDEITASDNGVFDDQKVEIRSFKQPAVRSFADTPSSSGDNDVEYTNNLSGSEARTASVRVMSRGFLTTKTTNNMYDPSSTSFQPAMVDDPEYGTDTIAQVDAYTELETTQKLYDYSWRVLYDRPDEVSDDGQDDFFTKAGDTLTTDDKNVTFSTSNLGGDDNQLNYDKDTNTINIKTQSNGEFDGNIDAGTADVTVVGKIIGGIVADNIENSFSDGDTIIDTTEAINGTISLEGGDFTINNADVSDLTVTRKSGETEDVRIIVSNVTGDPDVSAANVSLAKQITIDFDAKESYDSANLVTKFFATDGTDNDFNDITPETTTDNGNTITFTFYVDTDEDINYAISYVGLKPVNGTTSGATFTIETEEETVALESNLADSGDAQTFSDSSLEISDGASIGQPDGTNYEIDTGNAAVPYSFRFYGATGQVTDWGSDGIPNNGTHLTSGEWSDIRQVYIRANGITDPRALATIIDLGSDDEGTLAVLDTNNTNNWALFHVSQSGVNTRGKTDNDDTVTWSIPSDGLIDSSGSPDFTEDRLYDIEASDSLNYPDYDSASLDSNTDDVHVSMDVDGSLDGVSLTGAQAIAWFRYKLITSDDWMEGLAKQYINDDDIEFSAAQITIANSLSDRLRIRRKDNNNSNIFQMGSDISIIDDDGNDLSGTDKPAFNALQGDASTLDADNEIRFPQATDAATIGQVIQAVQSELDARLLNKDNVVNIGLGVPALNEEGDAFETNPNTPS